MPELNSFDHSELVKLPEYQTLRKALANLFARNDYREEPWTDEQLVQMATDCALTSAYGDACQNCQTINNEVSSAKYGRLPVRTEMLDGWPEFFYWCHECGSSWQTYRAHP